MDHPRIRGEHREHPGVEFAGDGSSPHTRGALLSCVVVAESLGIIPAYAGSTKTSLPPGRAGSGSSPHTRGAPRRRGVARSGRRIIPAYAGSTGINEEAPPARRDHPRIRGEHRPSLSHISPRPGSSPHTRGAQVVAEPRPQERRIIPAYAGSTRSPREARIPASDHPRIRGEHGGRAARYCSPAGSSPHTRGAPSGRRGPERDGGIIPAYAGSTGRASSASKRPADHPRIRGEHPGPWPASHHTEGSSPHTRGARRHPGSRVQGGGIIPAYAGSTQPGGSRVPGR